MKRRTRFVFMTLMLIVTACDNGTTTVGFPEGIISEPEPYDMWDKVKMAFGNHEKSLRYCQHVAQKFNDRPRGIDCSMYPEQCKKAKEKIVEKCNYIIENDDECWVAYYYRGYTEIMLTKGNEGYDDLMKAEQMNKENEYFYDSDTTYINRHHICSRLGWSIISNVHCGDSCCNGAFATKEEALRKAIEYLEESLEYQIPLERLRRNTYLGLSRACHELGDEKAEFWDAKLPKYHE